MRTLQDACTLDDWHAYGIQHAYQSQMGDGIQSMILSRLCALLCDRMEKVLFKSCTKVKPLMTPAEVEAGFLMWFSFKKQVKQQKQFLHSYCAAYIM